MKAIQVFFTKPFERIPGTRVALLIALAVLTIPPMLLTGCDATGGVRDAAQILADDIIPRMTGESEQWRIVWEETRDKLPADVRHQGDLAVERAVQAAGAEFRCDVDFIRTRLRQDLERIRAELLGQQVSPSVPHICSVWPESVIELDENLRPKDKGWIRFVGYDLDESDVQILLEFENDQTQDLSKCCLDNPTHYMMTVDLDEVSFVSKPRRIILKWQGGEKSVAINYPPPKPLPTPEPLPTTYEIIIKTGCVDDAGTSATVYISLFGSNMRVEDYQLDTPDYDDRERCQTDTYRIYSYDDLGDLQMIRIWHLNDNDKPGWFLEKVTVNNLRTGQQWEFPCNRWLAVGEGDHQISRDIYPGGPCQ